MRALAAPSGRDLPGVDAANDERDLVDTAEVARIDRQGLDLPLPPGRVREVHRVEGAREEVRLLPAFGATDLDDHRAAGVRVARHEQLAQLRFEANELGFGVGDLGFGQRPLGVARGSTEQLAGGGEVTGTGLEPLPGPDERFELAIPLRHRAQERRIGVGLGIGEARLEFAELLSGRREAVGDAGIDHVQSRLPA